MLACAPTELHTIGLEAIAVMLGRRGWSCNVLGAMTPPGSLLATLTATRGAGAIVTAQRSVGRRGAIEALRAAGQMPGVRLFYGGNAFATIKAREGVPGLYLGTDLRAAVEIVGVGDPLSDVAASVIEIAVGVACLLAAVGIFRRQGLGFVAAVLALAGVVAVVHAVIALT